MSDACEEAKNDLSKANQRQDAAVRWTAAKQEEVDAAVAERKRCEYEHNRAAAGAEGYDQRVSECTAALRAAESTLADAERNYEGSNRDARLRGLGEDVLKAKSELSDAQQKADSAWARVKERAGELEDARTAVTSAENVLSIAKSEEREADTWVSNATRRVSDACG